MKPSLLRTDKEFIQTYNKYVDTVYRVCFMYLKNAADTEDAVQTTFLKYLEYKKDFKDEEHLKAWLIVTASNHCKNQLNHWLRKVINFNKLEESSYEEDFSDNYMLDKILNLPKKYKLVIYMYYYEGYSTKEISEKINMNDSTVRSHLHRGRNLLKTFIEEDEDEE